MVLEGEGAINNVGQHRAKHPVVSVVDEISAPVKGGVGHRRRPSSAVSFW